RWGFGIPVLTERTDDDQNGFYDRSVGDVVNGTNAEQPYQLKGASHVNGSNAGNLYATYDAAGNLTELRLLREGTCLLICDQFIRYEWDEVGRLVSAKRWDDGTAEPSGDADVTLLFHYDSGDQRVVKTAIRGDIDVRHTVFVFASLELRRAVYVQDADPDESDYELTAKTESPYLFAGGVRLARVWHEPNVDSNVSAQGSQRVFFLLGERLGSISSVLDKATGELVERSTYLAYGGPDSDYRPERWRAFREDYRFTGKESDSEVGLVYFGKRYYSPQLGRWISPDPLEVHSPAQADGNLYAYVSGRALQEIDPVGFDGEFPEPPVSVDSVAQIDGVETITMAPVVVSNTGRLNMPEVPAVPQFQLGTAGEKIEFLIGGPYSGHPYGHAALHVEDSGGHEVGGEVGNSFVFDYGRYALVSGAFGESGEGIMRIWTDEQTNYVSEEQSLGRYVKGFQFSATLGQVESILNYYDDQLAAGTDLGSDPEQPLAHRFKLTQDYYATGPNCPTMCTGGFGLALPNVNLNTDLEFRGLDFLERAAMFVDGQPAHVVMPQDLEASLDRQARVGAAVQFNY
ncbi:MAG: RHS repeat-associated core domain-containing protein, partial [Planctomycetes bacterium]|nr:RHS repeat-associated core domain-containing protein [Planctomycetota bacterium]